MRRVLLGALLVLALASGAVLLLKPRATGPHVTIEDLRVGNGPPLENGSVVTVDYVTRVRDGAVIFDSRKSGQTFTFVVGAGQVLRGWEEGIQGLKVGGKRKILIPPELAYGARGSGTTVPPNATLEVEIELLRVEPPKSH